MRIHSTFGLAVIAVGLLASTAAFAEPTVTIDGISLPIGPSFLDNETSYEQLVTADGQSFGGVFKVQSIEGTGPDTYQYGMNGKYLYGEFTGFTVRQIPGDPGNTGNYIYLTGGSIKYIVSNTDNFQAFTCGGNTTPPAGGNGGTCQTADFAADGSGTVFLSATPETIDNFGDTLRLTLNTGNPATFSQANALAYLDVTGGDAAYNFNTNAQLNSFTNTAGADITFQGTANNASRGSDFGVNGSNDISANVVPEPGTISLIGAGLVAAASLRRRRKTKA